ncbi:MAG: DUF2461 domain-containing protein [Nitrospinales bacterium]
MKSLNKNISFDGFPKEGLAFLKNLKLNNDREWFQGNKAIYKTMVDEPAHAFLEAISDKLTKLSGEPMAGKIFRIYRDVRFSKDKTPYNAHIRMSFVRAGANKKKCGEAPMFSISIEPEKLFLGLGYFEFSKNILPSYQKAVAKDSTGKALKRIITKMNKKGLEFEGPEYKRVPSGYDKDHPRGDLLRRKGLSLWSEVLIPKELHSSKAIEFCINKFRDMLPFYKWLQTLG